MSAARVGTMLAGVGLAVAGRYVGGVAGAVLLGAGLGLAVLALGRRRPHALRRGDDDDRW